MKMNPGKQLQKRLAQVVLVTILPLITIPFISPQPTYGIQTEVSSEQMYYKLLELFL